MVYICIFSIATFLFYIGDKSNKKIKFCNAKSVSIKSIDNFFGIIVLSLLAGLRADCIGTDVQTYVVYAVSRVATRSSIFEAIKYRALDVGYELLCYFSYKIIPDIHFLHFVTSLIVISCLIYFIAYFEDKINYPIAMLVFMLMYFNTSLNIVRQFLAISISLVGYRLFLEKKYLKSICLYLIAISFHVTAIIALSIPIIYIFLQKNKNSKWKIIGIVTVFIIMEILLQPIINLFVGFGILSSKYLAYFEDVGNSSILNQLLYRIPIIICGVGLYKKMDKHDEMNHIFLGFLIIDALLGALAPLIGDGSRISYYFGIFNIIYIPELIKVMETKVTRPSRIIIKSCFMGYLLMYWGYCFLIRNFSDTYPYISDILFSVG